MNIVDITPKIRLEISNAVEEAIMAFRITNPENGKDVVKQVEDWIYNISENNEWPGEYAKLEDVAVGLGSLFGYCMCHDYGWEWKKMIEDDHGQTIVLSPGGKAVVAPFTLVYKMLVGKNIGPEGKNDINLQLIYDKAKDVDRKLKKTTRFA